MKNLILNSVYKSEIFFKFLVIFLFFHYFLFSLIKSVSYLFSISLSFKSLILLDVIGLIFFIFASLFPLSFSLFQKIVTSDVFFRYWIFIYKTLVFLIKQTPKTVLFLLALYSYVMMGCFIGFITGLEAFQGFLNLYPSFYILRTLVFMPILFITILEKHPLFNDFTNRLYIGETIGGRNLGQLFLDLMKSPGGKASVKILALGGGGSTAASLHQTSVQTNLEGQYKATNQMIETLPARDPKLVTPEKEKLLNGIEYELQHLRLQSHRGMWNSSYNDVKATLTSKPTLTDQGYQLNRDRLSLERSMRPRNFESFASSGNQAHSPIEIFWFLLK